MKTTTLIKRINERERIFELATVFAHHYSRCKVEEVADLVRHFSKQLDIILKIK